jgi:hypothetical protein
MFGARSQASTRCLLCGPRPTCPKNSGATPGSGCANRAKTDRQRALTAPEQLHLTARATESRLSGNSARAGLATRLGLAFSNSIPPRVASRALQKLLVSS